MRLSVVKHEPALEEIFNELALLVPNSKLHYQTMLENRRCHNAFSRLVDALVNHAVWNKQRLREERQKLRTFSDRNLNIYEMRKAGYTFRAIANKHSLSVERIREIYMRMERENLRKA